MTGSNNDVSFEDKVFEIYIPKEDLANTVSSLAAKLNKDYGAFDLEIILISILDGSFIFMADLVRQLTFPHKIHFVKLKSYQGMESTGQIQYILDMESTEVTGKHVIIIEDIVDTGLTIASFVEKLEKADPLSVKTCALLSKPDVHNDIIDIHYLGKEIPPLFVIGYGLDINGYGRNLPGIYKLKI